MERFILGFLIAGAVLILEEEAQYWNAVLQEHEEKPIGYGKPEKAAVDFLEDIEDRVAFVPFW